MGDVGRRAWLGLAAGVTLAGWTRPSLAAPRARHLPATLDDLLDEAERILSPDALAIIARKTDAELFDFAKGVYYAAALGLDERGRDARTAIFAARGVSDFSEQRVFLVTSLARRRRGEALDVEAQLAAWRALAEREREQAERWRREHPGVIIRADQLEVVDVFYFERGTARLAPGQDELVASFPRFLRDFTEIKLTQVVGHAARGERDALAISEARARAIVELLVAAGVAPSRLTLRGLGAAYPDLDSDHAKRPGRDQRVEFFVLERPRMQNVR
jgi:outer membrane protein OmpA-like peptidoglycan-associated protein